MLNILIATFGSVGDVLPFIGVGRELRERGHDVTLFTSPYFKSHAAEAGLELSPLGSVEDYHQLINDSSMRHWKTVVDGYQKGGFAARLKLVARIVEPAYEAIAKLHEPGRTVFFGSQFPLVWIAPEKWNIPSVLGLVSPRGITSRFDPPHPSRPLPPFVEGLMQTRSGLRLSHWLRGRLNKLRRLRRKAAPRAPEKPVLEEIKRVRASLHLPEIGSRGVQRFVPQRIVCMWPDWFADRQSDWPPQALITGFPFYPPFGNEAEELSCRPQEPNGNDLLVFTTGSVPYPQPAFFSAAVEACRILKRPGLLVSPHADDIPRPLPSHVTQVEDVPFGQLFPRSALVVHHGGVGTTALALASGVPQIVKPRVGEHFDLGNRMQRLGVGRMLSSETMSPVKLARVIDSLLKSEQVSKRCRYWQERVDRGTGLTQAADAIESVAS
jgi:rhamnosyltransferase subunit B